MPAKPAQVQAPVAVATEGHNLPPKDILLDLEKDLKVITDKLCPLVQAEIKKGEAIKKVETEEEAQAATQAIADIQKLAGQVEKKRKDVKAPWIAGGKIIEKTFTDQETLLTLAKAKVQKLLNPYNQKKDEEAREALRIAQAAAKAASDKALADAAALEDAGMKKEADKMLKTAEVAETKADRMDTALKSGGLAITRTDSGAASSQHSVATAEIENEAELDMAALWPHISVEAKQTALNKWMAAEIKAERMTKDKIPTLKGARLYYKISTVVRG